MGIESIVNEIYKRLKEQPFIFRTRTFRKYGIRRVEIYATITFLVISLSVIPVALSYPEYMKHLLVTWIVMFTLPTGIFLSYTERIIRNIERAFADFLRDLAENLRAGMSLVEAMKLISEGEYGTLTFFLRKIVSSMLWGENFFELLEDFSRKIGSPLISRAITLIKEGFNVGGDLSDVLLNASQDIRTYLELRERLRTQSVGYVITAYVSYGVYIFTILIVLLYFIPKISSGVESPVTISGITIKPPDVAALKDVLYYGSIAQSVGIGAVTGVLSRGRPSGAPLHVSLMALITYAVFFVTGLVF